MSNPRLVAALAILATGPVARAQTCPDLVIALSSLTFTAPYVHYAFVITNAGSCPASIGGLVVQAYVSADRIHGNAGDRPAGGLVISVATTLAPGGSHAAAFSATPIQPWSVSTHPFLTIKIDEGNALAESDEGNNTAARQLPGAFVEFGSGCAGSGGVPRWSACAGSIANAGSPFCAEATNLGTNTGDPVFMLLGGPLPPFPLDGLGMPGCDLVVLPFVDLMLPRVGGTATWNINIASSPGTVGLRFYTQCLVFDSAGANTAGITVTNGADCIIG